AQSTKTKARRTKRTSRTTPYYQLGTGMMMWQEKIEGEKGGAKANFMTQSIGAKLSYTYNQFYGERSRWRKIYSGEAMVGTIKGKAHGIFTDELNKQPWLAVQGVAGWVYRTAPVSEVGLFVPAIVRFIGWDLAAGSSLKMDKQ